ncbi:MAG: cytochrome C [Anaerolineaceae bacterium]|nr:cytochrome C [Anaerolineaceae bacterium]
MIKLGLTFVLVLCVSVLLLLTACNGRPLRSTSDFVAGGNPQAGWQAVQDYGCHTCHTIPGIPGPDAYVGPPLDEWASRSYIAGNLSNTPDNLVEWIRFPQDIEPGTVMPDLDVTEDAARNISAYLFNLR